VQDEVFGRDTLSVIDTARVGEGKLAVVGSLAAGVFPREFGQSPDGRTLFVANYLSDELEVIDLTLLPLDKAKQARSTRLLW
jgi:DNA-binding beta-propeller fold protein YncE